MLFVGGDGARARGGAGVKTGDAGGGVSSKPGAGDARGDCAGARTGVVGNGAAGASGAPTASGAAGATASGDGAPAAFAGIVGGAGETAATSGLRFLFRLAPRGFPRLTGAGAPKSALPKMARGTTLVKDPAVSSLQH